MVEEPEEEAPDDADADATAGEEGDSEDSQTDSDPLVDSGLIEHLTECIEWAQDGHLRSFLTLGVGRDGCSFAGFSTIEQSDLLVLIGESVCLTHRLIDMVKEINDGSC